MDNKPNTSPELPLPINESVQNGSDKKAESEPSVEHQSFVREASNQQGPIAAAPPQDISLTTPPQSAVPLTPLAAAIADDTSTHPVADDSDVIEKEWVEKAKSIVASTRTDPRAQNRELNKFKAEYISKRFNKNLKLAEDAA